MYRAMPLVMRMLSTIPSSTRQAPGKPLPGAIRVMGNVAGSVAVLVLLRMPSMYIRPSVASRTMARWWTCVYQFATCVAQFSSMVLVNASSLMVTPCQSQMKMVSPLPAKPQRPPPLADLGLKCISTVKGSPPTPSSSVESGV